MDPYDTSESKGSGVEGVLKPITEENAKEKVISHLLFYKALAYDNLKDSERISRYISMIEAKDDGMMIQSMDPYERTISIALELVIEERMDPWDLDLKRFARYYMRRLEAEHLIDLPIAGKLYSMVWSLLEIKSEHLLEAATNTVEDNDPYLYGGIDDFFSDFVIDDETTKEEDDIPFSEVVISAPTPPIHEPVRRKAAKRPATLMELINALEKIRKEVIKYRRKRSLNKEMTEEYRKQFEKLLRSEVHKDDIKAEMSEVMERIIGLSKNGEYRISIRDLLPKNFTKWDVLMVFVAILHLTKEDMISVYQDSFPYGEIYVEPKSK